MTRSHRIPAIAVAVLVGIALSTAVQSSIALAKSACCCPETVATCAGPQLDETKCCSLREGGRAPIAPIPTKEPLAGDDPSRAFVGLPQAGPAVALSVTSFDPRSGSVTPARSSPLYERNSSLLI
jgi:hypothetical protein